MARGKIDIVENYCKGCRLCVKFCSKNCIEISKDKLNPNGYLLPIFANQDECTGCGICGWMCPECTIDVYRYVEG